VASYDSFTVTKSVTVTTDSGVVARIVVPASATGILVNAAAMDVVALKGLTLIGAGSGTGISIQSVSRASVEDCDSRNFFHALEYVTSVPGTLEVKGCSFSASDTSIFLCCNATSSPGIAVSVDGAHVWRTLCGRQRRRHPYLSNEYAVKRRSRLRNQ
jgi:hypothetical protein